MNQDLLKSIAFHLCIAILLVVSTWSIFARHIEPINEVPIVVQLAPIGEKTNVKPAPKQQVKPPAPKPPQPKTEPKPTPPKPPEPKKAEPKPATKIEPKKVEKPPKKDALDQELEKLDKENKDKDKDLNALLKNLDDKPTPTKSTDQKVTKEDSKSDQQFDPNSPEALAEQDYVVKLVTDQVKVCWSPPVGGLDAKKMVVRVNVDIAQDGTMKFVGFDGDSQFASDPLYLAASDAAKRAVLNPECNPLKQLPPIDKYSIWKEMTIIFDPKEQGN